MSIKTAATKLLRIRKQFIEDVCRVNKFAYPKPICKNQPPETTNLMNACLSCPLRDTCRLLFVDEEERKKRIDPLLDKDNHIIAMFDEWWYDQKPGTHRGLKEKEKAQEEWWSALRFVLKTARERNCTPSEVIEEELRKE